MILGWMLVLHPFPSLYEILYTQISFLLQWGLECSSEYTYATTLLKTLQMIGVLVGATLGGQLADIFGRRKVCLSLRQKAFGQWCLDKSYFFQVLFGLYTAMTIAGFASAFANSWQLYTVTAFRFVIGAFTGGQWVFIMNGLWLIRFKECVIIQWKHLFSTMKWVL